MPFLAVPGEESGGAMVDGSGRGKIQKKLTIDENAMEDKVKTL